MQTTRRQNHPAAATGAHVEHINTLTGKLSFTHDFANGCPERRIK